MLIATTPDLPTMHNNKGWQWLICYYDLTQARTYTVSEILLCCIQGPFGLYFSRMVRKFGQHHLSPGFQEPHTWMQETMWFILWWNKSTLWLWFVQHHHADMHTLLAFEVMSMCHAELMV